MTRRVEGFVDRMEGNARVAAVEHGADPEFGAWLARQITRQFTLRLGIAAATGFAVGAGAALLVVALVALA